jgi:hypothetical protein
MYENQHDFITFYEFEGSWVLLFDPSENDLGWNSCTIRVAKVDDITYFSDLVLYI